MTPLQAKKENYLFEVGNFLKKQFPLMENWKLDDPDENILKEAYFYAIVRIQGQDKRVCITNTHYNIAFKLIGEGMESINDRIASWFSAHADELLKNGVHSYSYKELGNDAEFIDALLEEIAQKGFDVLREKDMIKVERLD